MQTKNKKSLFLGSFVIGIITILILGGLSLPVVASGSGGINVGSLEYTSYPVPSVYQETAQVLVVDVSDDGQNVYFGMNNKILVDNTYIAQFNTQTETFTMYNLTYDDEPITFQYHCDIMYINDSKVGERVYMTGRLTAPPAPLPLYYLDLETQTIEYTILTGMEHGEITYDLAYSPQNNHLYVSVMVDSSFHILQVNLKNSKVTEIGVSDNGQIALDTDTGYLYWGHNQQWEEVEYWDGHDHETFDMPRETLIDGKLYEIRFGTVNDALIRSSDHQLFLLSDNIVFCPRGWDGDEIYYRVAIVQYDLATQNISFYTGQRGEADIHAFNMDLGNNEESIWYSIDSRRNHWIGYLELTSGIMYRMPVPFDCCPFWVSYDTTSDVVWTAQSEFEGQRGIGKAQISSEWLVTDKTAYETPIGSTITVMTNSSVNNDTLTIKIYDKDGKDVTTTFTIIVDRIDSTHQNINISVPDISGLIGSYDISITYNKGKNTHSVLLYITTKAEAKVFPLTEVLIFGVGLGLGGLIVADLIPKGKTRSTSNKVATWIAVLIGLGGVCYAGYIILKFMGVI